MLDYLQLYPETLQTVKRYNEAQRCRLYEAMACYAFTGEEPSWPDDAPEWFVWEALRQQVERTQKKVQQNRANASQTERTEAKASESKRTRANASQTERTEAKASETPIQEIRNKNIESDKETESDNYYDGNSAGAWVTDSEVHESLERDRQIEDKARTWGLPCQEGHMIKARELARVYTLEWLLRAIETAGNGSEQTWRYVDGILRRWKEQGGPDAPRKQQSKPAKTVSAQQYTQREYTEEELSAICGDNELLEEARKLRDTG